MYHPYFRGKQYELMTIRECADILASSEFVPIIEPVKKNINGLVKAIASMIDAEGDLVLIVNPKHGDHAEDSEEILSLLDDDYSDENHVKVGILLDENITIEHVLALCDRFRSRSVYIIHDNFNDVKELAVQLSDLDQQDIRHVFLDNHGRLYRSRFRDTFRIVMHDGFEKKRNKDYTDIELFSELHVTYSDIADGFGDFLIVGDDYSTSGGPAYTVAIHLTFIDPDEDDVMYVYHFKSDRQDTTADPAGKFAEALDKLVVEVNRSDSKIFRSNAVEEYLTLHRTGHFPGLGYVKKLSMNHHIETLANYFNQD